MYKVSVIMPIFNAEKYLKNTLNSVINQTIGFENIELILVDDCSTDNSRRIIMEYSKNYSNIRGIFLEKNAGGPSIPRNIGIKNASADYIMFIDNDDEYFPEICDKLYDTLIFEDADVVVCNALCTSLDGNISEFSWKNSDRILWGGEIIYLGNVFVWNCIFKKSIILDNDLKFVDGVYEDAIFILEYSIHSKKLVYLSDFEGYHHIRRDNSLSTFSIDRELETIDTFYICARILEKNNCDLNRFFRSKIQARIINALFAENKDEIKMLYTKLADFERKINFNSNLQIGFNLINFFILHEINIATYIALFLSKFRKSNLFVSIGRKLFLK